jgi:nicotinamidase-related amidase
MLSRTQTSLIVIDFQGNLFQAMNGKEDLLKNSLKVIVGTKALNVPIILTEQTPQKLGLTISEIALELKDTEPVSKESFSCWGQEAFREKLKKIGRRNAILIGIECHVCVYQTAVDLMANGYAVYIVADAVSSRTKGNCAIGLEAMKSAGAHITGAEMLLFELLRSSGDAGFKEIYQIVK